MPGMAPKGNVTFVDSDKGDTTARSKLHDDAASVKSAGTRVTGTCMYVCVYIYIHTYMYMCVCV